jgi:hypothetical protein
MIISATDIVVKSQFVYDVNIIYSILKGDL